MKRPTPWTPEERADYLSGQVHALAAFAQAVLVTHPDPAQLRQVFEEQLLKTEANLLFQPMHDSWLQGARDVQALLYPPGTNAAES